MLSPNQCILAGLILRFGFILYAEIQDKFFNLKYTDIDYSVYSDGANYVLQGGTPYDRHTYRYTPILAYLMVPNIIWFESFGKVLFSIVDILTTLIINKLISFTSLTITNSTRAFLLSLWLFNPIIIQVSTRGNADTIVVFLVYLMLYFLLKKRIILAALTYGFVVHFKVYPIIYSLTIYFFIDCETQNQRKLNFRFIYLFRNLFAIFTKNRIKFALISGGLFIILLVIFHLLYPDMFLYQTYFYHLIRKDNRHNFSPYFYFIYLHFTSMTPSQSTLAFLPQLLIVLMAGIRYYKDLPFAMLIQTMGFVAFNKVCTAQYFVWWMALLPLALTNNNLKEKSRVKFLVISLIWLILEVSWNIGAYLVEIRGYNAFLLIFLSCITFFIGNVYLIYTLIVNHIPKRFVSLEKLKQK